MSHAVVLGSASCMWDDLRDWQDNHWAYWMGPGVYIAVNDAGTLTLPIHHWCHLHVEDMLGRLEDRSKGLPFPPTPCGSFPAYNDFVTWSRRHGMDGDMPISPDRIAPQHLGPGSSGLYAVGIALYELQIPRVILCGVPMDDRPRLGENVPWNEADPAQGIDKLDLFRPVWERAVPKMAGRVRSMSGWTRELLGYPTASWLTSEHAIP